MNIFHALPESRSALTETLVEYRRPSTDQRQYLSHLTAQTRTQLASRDFAEKMAAALKLLFLLGEAPSGDYHWAAFNVIELLGSPRLEHKRLAYLLLPLVLKTDQPLMTLLPNLIRRDLRGMSGTVSLALGCLARLCTEEIGTLLAKDLLPLFTSS